MKVPSQCRNDFHKMYKALKQNSDFLGFSFEEGLASEGNRAVFTKIVESIYSDYGGKEQCPWSVEQLRESSATYYRSLTDAKQEKPCSKQTNIKQAVEGKQGKEISLATGYLP